MRRLKLFLTSWCVWFFTFNLFYENRLKTLCCLLLLTVFHLALALSLQPSSACFTKFFHKAAKVSLYLFFIVNSSYFRSNLIVDSHPSRVHNGFAVREGGQEEKRKQGQESSIFSRFGSRDSLLILCILGHLSSFIDGDEPQRVP